MGSIKPILVIIVVVAGYFFWQIFGIHPGQKHFQNSEFANSRNSASCDSCHVDGSGLEFIGKKSQFLVTEKTYNTVEAVIDEVMIPFYLEGQSIGQESKQMAELIDFLKGFAQD